MERVHLYPLDFDLSAPSSINQLSPLELALVQFHSKATATDITKARIKWHRLRAGVPKKELDSFREEQEPEETEELAIPSKYTRLQPLIETLRDSNRCGYASTPMRMVSGKLFSKCGWRFADVDRVVEDACAAGLVRCKGQGGDERIELTREYCVGEFAAPPPARSAEQLGLSNFHCIDLNIPFDEITSLATPQLLALQFINDFDKQTTPEGVKLADIVEHAFFKRRSSDLSRGLTWSDPQVEVKPTRPSRPPTETTRRAPQPPFRSRDEPPTPESPSQRRGSGNGSASSRRSSPEVTRSDNRRRSGCFNQPCRWDSTPGGCDRVNCSFTHPSRANRTNGGPSRSSRTEDKPTRRRSNTSELSSAQSEGTSRDSDYVPLSRRLSRDSDPPTRDRRRSYYSDNNSARRRSASPPPRRRRRSTSPPPDRHRRGNSIYALDSQTAHYLQSKPPPPRRRSHSSSRYVEPREPAYEGYALTSDDLALDLSSDLIRFVPSKREFSEEVIIVEDEIVQDRFASIAPEEPSHYADYEASSEEGEIKTDSTPPPSIKLPSLKSSNRNPTSSSVAPSYPVSPDRLIDLPQLRVTLLTLPTHLTSTGALNYIFTQRCKALAWRSEGSSSITSRIAFRLIFWSHKHCDDASEWLASAGRYWYSNYLSIDRTSAMEGWKWGHMTPETQNTWGVKVIGGGEKIEEGEVEEESSWRLNERLYETEYADLWSGLERMPFEEQRESKEKTAATSKIREVVGLCRERDLRKEAMGTMSQRRSNASRKADVGKEDGERR